jgi:hypothetical protein
VIVAFMLVGAEQVPLAERMVASVRRTMGRVHVLQQSDETTPVVRGVDEVSRKPYSGFLMPYRFQHLKDIWADTLVLDTDIILQTDPREHKDFAGEWDVALTYRKGPILDKNGTDVAKLYPINTGFMVSRTRDFWVDCLACLQQMQDKDLDKWYGDQFAVKAVAESGKYRVRELPCAKWNYTPGRADENSAAHVLHFKGLRKQWMLDRYGV